MTAFAIGIRFAWRQRLIRAFTVSESTYLFGFSILQAVLLVYLARELRLAPSIIGFVFVAGTFGGLIGAVVAHRFSGFVLGSAIRGIGLLLTPLAAIAPPTLIIPILVGSRLINAFGWSLWQIQQETRQQLLTPQELRGRVTGSALFVVRSAEAVGGFVAAGLASTLGALPTLILGAVIAAVATCGLLSVRTNSTGEKPGQEGDLRSGCDNVE